MKSNLLFACLANIALSSDPTTLFDLTTSISTITDLTTSISTITEVTVTLNSTVSITLSNPATTVTTNTNSLSVLPTSSGTTVTIRTTSSPTVSVIVLSEVLTTTTHQLKKPHHHGKHHHGKHHHGKHHHHKSHHKKKPTPSISVAPTSESCSSSISVAPTSVICSLVTVTKTNADCDACTTLIVHNSCKTLCSEDDGKSGTDGPTATDDGTDGGDNTDGTNTNPVSSNPGDILTIPDSTTTSGPTSTPPVKSNAAGKYPLSILFVAVLAAVCIL